MPVVKYIQQHTVKLLGELKSEVKTPPFFDRAHPRNVE
jgi:hypothetical protein